MAIPTLSGSYIDQTYQRLVQTDATRTEFADGLGNPISFGGTTVPGGPNKSLQFNNNSTFTGSNNLTFDSASNALSLTGSLLLSQSYISKVDYVDFSTRYDTVTPVDIPTHQEGRLFYDTGSQTLCLYNGEADITLNIGQESWLRARNQTGVTITNGSVVRISGAVGNRPKVELAQSSDQTNVFGVTNDIIGMATHDIEQGTDGFVTTFGLVNGVDTSGFIAGDLLWVSQSAGQYTNVAPSAPYDKTFIGVVTRVNPNNGTIFVTPQQPIHFHDLSSVSASANYTQGQLWMYRASGSSGVWTNTSTLSGSYIISGSLISTSGFTGSLIGTASLAISASYAISSSRALNANNASFAGLVITLNSNTNQDYSVVFAPSGSNGYLQTYTDGASNLLYNPGTDRLTVPNLTATSITGSLFGTASWTTNAVSSSFASTASYTPNALTTASISSNVITFTKGNGTTFALTVNTGSGGGGGSISTSGSTLYSTNPAAGSGFNTTGSIILGTNAGASATNANNSVFIGTDAGNNATDSQYSNFLGLGTGYLAINSRYSNFLGYYAGAQTSQTDRSNFFGKDTGRQADKANYSNFLGEVAGFGAINAFNSNFLGYYAGTYAASASYSTLIGYHVGYNATSDTNLGIKSNNIIIGTNITLPDGAQDSINLGGIIFATGSYATTIGNPYSGSMYGSGKVGINKVSPSYTLDISGSINFSDTIYQNGVPYGGGALSGGTTGYIPVFTSATSVTSSYLFQDADLLKTIYGGTDQGLILRLSENILVLGRGSSIGDGYAKGVLVTGVTTPIVSIGDMDVDSPGNSTRLIVNDYDEKVTINKHLEVEMGSIVPYYTVSGIDLSAAAYHITSSGVFEITNADGNIDFPNPSTHDGQIIIVVNTDTTYSALIDNTNTYAPYNRGINTQLSYINTEDMFTFVSIGGKWRGMAAGK